MVFIPTHLSFSLSLLSLSLFLSLPPSPSLAVGKPLGPYKRAGKYKFSREFEHLSVSLDCDGFGTSFEWH